MKNEPRRYREAREACRRINRAWAESPAGLFRAVMQREAEGRRERLAEAASKGLGVIRTAEAAAGKFQGAAMRRPRRLLARFLRRVTWAA